MNVSFTPLILAALTISANAAVSVSGNFISGSPTPRLEVTNEIVINVISSGTASYLVFDEWVISDGNSSTAFASSGQNLSYNLGGGSLTRNLNSLTDNLANNVGSITENDGYLIFGGISVTAGDVFTVETSSYTFGPDTGFNNAISGSTFSGNFFLTDSSGSFLGGTAPIPEPSVALLSGLGLLGLLHSKR